MTRTLFAFIAVTLLALFTVLASAQESYYEQALKSFNSGEFEEAQIYLKNALKEQPDYLPANILFAQVLIELGTLEQAQQHIEFAIRNGADIQLAIFVLAESLLKQNKNDALLNLKDSYSLNAKTWDSLLRERVTAMSRLGKVDEAIALLQSKINRAEPDISLIAKLASLHIKQNNVTKAANVLDAAGTFSNHPEYIKTNAQLLHAKQQYQSAIIEFRRVVDMQKADGEVYKGLANAYLAMEQFALADQALEQALAINPQDPFSIYMKGSVLQKLNQSKASTILLEQIANQLSLLGSDYRQSNPRLILIEGMSHFAVGNWQSARDSFETYLAIEKADIDAVIMLAQTFVKLDLSKRALDLLLRHEHAIKKVDEYLLILAGLYLESNKSIRAEPLVMEILARSPNNETALVYLARIYATTGRTEQAIAHLSAVDDTQSARLHHTLAALHQGVANWDKVREHIEALLTIAPDNFEYQLFNVQSLVLSGDLHQANEKLQELVNKHQNEAQLNFLTAQIMLQLGELETAKSALTPLVEQQPQRDEYRFLMAQIHQSLGDYDEAIESFESVVRHNDFREQALLQLAQLYQSVDQLKFALRAINELLQSSRLNPEAIRIKAQILFKLDRINESHQQLSILQSLWTNEPENLLNLARLQKSLGDTKGEQASLNRAIELAPDSPVVLYNFAQFKIANKDLEQAQQHISKLASVTSSVNPAVLLLRGDINVAKGEFQTAFNNYSKSFEANSNSIDLLYKLAAISDNTARSAKFVAICKQLLANYPGKTYVYELLAEHLLGQGVYEESRYYYQQLLTHEIPPIKRAIASNNLAYLYTQMGAYELAIDMAKVAIEIRKDIPIFYDTLGWALSQSGLHEAGLTQLRQASVMASNDAGINFHLASILHKLGKNKDAKEILTSIPANNIDDTLKSKIEVLKQSLLNK